MPDPFNGDPRETAHPEAAWRDLATDLIVQGPVPGLDEEVRELHRRFRG